MRAVSAGCAVVALLLASGASALAAETPSANAAAGDVATEVRTRFAADPNTLGRSDGTAVVVVPASASRDVTSAPYRYVAEPPPPPPPMPGGYPYPYAYGPAPAPYGYGPMPGPYGYAPMPMPMPMPPDPCCLRCPRWTLSIGGWFWGIDGRVADSGPGVDVDSDWTDAFEHLDELEFAIDARLRVEWNRWTATLQLDGATFEDGTTFRRGGTTPDGSVSLWMLQGDVGYKIEGGPLGCEPCAPTLCTEVYFGGRIYWVDADIDGTIGALAPVSASMTWIDPLVGFRTHLDLRRWRFGLEGDIGGFGLGSDSSWSLTGFVGFRFNQTFGVVAGWRGLDVDYDDDGELFDATVHGPFVAITLTF